MRYSLAVLSNQQSTIRGHPACRADGCQMNLCPRKDIHLQALDNCRVILKGDGLEVEIGSIGTQHGSGTSEYWAWAIDTVIPMRTHQS